MTRNAASGETYVTHRLVESRRVGDKVRQVTLLNLGRHFALPRERWPELCQRLDQLLRGQQALVPAAESVERIAQPCFARLLAQGPVALPVPDAGVTTYAEVDPDRLELTQPRSIGVEHVVLAAMRELAFEPFCPACRCRGCIGRPRC